MAPVLSIASWAGASSTASWTSTNGLSRDFAVRPAIQAMEPSILQSGSTDTPVRCGAEAPGAAMRTAPHRDESGRLQRCKRQSPRLSVGPSRPKGTGLVTRPVALVASVVVAATLLSAAQSMPRVLVWNITASVPTGLYLVSDEYVLRTGDRVAVEPSPTMRNFMVARGYLASGVPLLKQIAAVPGDTVCRIGYAIDINGDHAGFARKTDSQGRPMPAWQGCHVLGGNEIFVMSPAVPDSFDSRYFGPLPRARVTGRAIPLWTGEPGAGLRDRLKFWPDPPLPTTNERNTR